MVKKALNKSKKNASKEIEPNQINILKETKVEYVNLDIEMGSKVEEMLMKHARENIMNDKQALLNWAFIDALEKGIELMDKKKGKV